MNAIFMKVATGDRVLAALRGGAAIRRPSTQHQRTVLIHVITARDFLEAVRVEEKR